MSRIYKVEMVDIRKKYASIQIEAENEKEAIAKARQLQWEDFDEVEAAEQTTWETKSEWSLSKFLSSLFRA
mgnify:CR=1 FL=1|jgi:hypothetical protein